MTDRAGVLLVAGAASLWGTWSIFLRPTGLPGAVTGPLVFALMGVFLLPAVARGPRAVWDREALALFAMNVGLDALNVLTFFEALHRTTVAIATLTHYLAPILVALAAPLVDREHVPRARAWALIATAGLVLVLAPWDRDPDAPPILAGALLGAVSAVAYAGNVFVVRRLVPRIGAERAVSYHALAGALLIAPLGLAHVDAITGADLGRLAIGSLVLGSVAGAMFVRGLARIGSSRAAVLTFAEPTVAVLVGWLYWREPLAPTAIAGAALIVAAGIGVSRGRDMMSR
jgi:drug/metabolite transporter (DMT)-like permease